MSAYENAAPNPFGVSIGEVLESLGSKTDGRDMYYSPFREESAPSLHVDRKRDLWYDHGAGFGGNMLKLVEIARGCTKRQASRYLFSLADAKNLPSQGAGGTSAKSPSDGTDYKFEVVSVGPIAPGAILSYMKGRGISEGIASKYCSTVRVRYKDSLGGESLWLGFENAVGGFALNNPFGKKRSTRAFPTFIDMKGERSGEASSDTVAVFEGFFDFLSFLEWRGTQTPPCDVAVLNSVANLHKASSYILSHGEVECYLDRDSSGKKCLREIRSMVGEENVTDKSTVYEGFNDFNEALVSWGKPSR